jgi:hypothetical protein
MVDDKLAARLAQLRADLLMAAADADDATITTALFRLGLALGAGHVGMKATDAVLALHGSMPVYRAAPGCGHPEPDADAEEWMDWYDSHVPGTGDVGRVCLLTQTASYCPECTFVKHGDEEPDGDDYVPAPCVTREAILKAVTGG